MIDAQSTELDIAIELGFRIVKTAPDSYQYQKLDAAGRTLSVTPTQQHAWLLWTELVQKAIALGTALDEGGEGGGGAQPGKSQSPQMA